MPIESFRIQWRFINSDWNDQYVKDLEIVGNSMLDKGRVYVVEIASLIPSTDYLFRIASVNKVGLGVWSKDEKVATAPRRQPDPVRIESKEDCGAATRCAVEWGVESNGGSAITEFTLRWRRVIFFLFF